MKRNKRFDNNKKVKIHEIIQPEPDNLNSIEVVAFFKGMYKQFKLIDLIAKYYSLQYNPKFWIHKKGTK